MHFRSHFSISISMLLLCSQLMAGDTVDLSASSLGLATEAFSAAYNQSTEDLEKDKSRPRIAHLIAKNSPFSWPVLVKLGFENKGFNEADLGWIIDLYANPSAANTMSEAQINQIYKLMITDKLTGSADDKATLMTRLFKPSDSLSNGSSYLSWGNAATEKLSVVGRIIEQAYYHKKYLDIFAEILQAFSVHALKSPYLIVAKRYRASTVDSSIEADHESYTLSDWLMRDNNYFLTKGYLTTNSHNRTAAKIMFDRYLGDTTSDDPSIEKDLLDAASLLFQQGDISEEQYKRITRQ